MANKKWRTEKELKKKVEKFFKYCVEAEKPITRTSLAVYLGITKTKLLRYINGEYDTEENVYSNILTFADTKIEEYAESLLFTRDKGHNAIMFYLKTNFGWSEKTDDEKSEDISVNISVI